MRKKSRKLTQQNKELVCDNLNVWASEFIIGLFVARKAALALLVDEETEVLATIDRYKSEASRHNKEANIQRFLERVAQPKKWKYKDGTTTEME